MNSAFYKLLLKIFIAISIVLLVAVLLISYTNLSNKKKKTASQAAMQTDIISQSAAAIDSIYSDRFFSTPDSLFNQGNFDSAAIHYKKASRYFLLEGNWQKYIVALNKTADCYINNRYYDSALVILNYATDIGQENLSKNHPIGGDTYFLLGKYYDFTNDPERAIQYHQKALEIRTTTFGESSPEVAKSYKGLGDVYYYIFRDYINAEMYYKKSLKIRELPALQVQAELIQVYYALASIYRMKKDFKLALIFGNKALTLSGELIDRKSYYLSLCYSLLANVNYELKNYDKAILLYNQAIEIEKQTENAPFIVSEYYNNLGFFYTDRKEYEKAAFFLKEGLKLKKSQINHDLKEIFQSYYNLGWFHSEFKQLDSAKYYYDKCLEGRISLSGLNSLEVAEVYNSLGKLNENADNLDYAIQFYQRAIKSLIKYDSLKNSDLLSSVTTKNYTPELLEVVINAANIYLKLNINSGSLDALKTSLEYYKLADQLNGFSRRSFQMEDSKLFMEEYYESEFEKAIQVASKLYGLTGDPKYLDQVYLFMEKGKYVLLSESLAEAERYNKAGIPHDLKARENDLLVQSAYYRDEMEKEIEKEVKDAQRMRNLEQKEYELSRQLSELKEQLSKEYPNYFQIKYDSIASSLQDVHGFVKNTDKQIIEYYWGDSLLYILSVDNDTTRFLTIDNWEIQSITEKYLSLLTNIDYSDSSFQLYQQYSHQLYDKILAPIISKNSSHSNKSLVIIPDGPLAGIPFEALITKETKSKEVDYKSLSYLVKEYNVSYAYSSQLLLHSATIPEEARDLKLLAFSFSDAKRNLRSEVAKNGYGDLAGSVKEIEAISSLIPGTFLSGEEATEDNFKAKVADYDIIHLALHGSSDSKKGSKPKLIFKKSDGGVEDGNLYPYELYNLNLKSQLAVLSACETGTGKLIRGEGIYSMARGFAYAGCPSIIMSLWKVNDMTSAELMLTFYKQLFSGAELNEALRNSKIQYLDNSDQYAAHPAHWASFVALGANRSFAYSKAHSSWGWIAAGIFSLLLLFFLIKRSRKSTKITTFNY